MEFRFASLIVSVVVGVVLLSTLLLPIISDTTETERTFKNTGFYYLTDIGEDESYEYTFVSNGTWTVNNETINFLAGAYNVIVTDEHFVRSNGQIESTSFASCTFTVTADGITGSYVILGETYTINWSVDGFYGAVPKTDDYIMTNPDVTTYVKGDSMVLGFGVSSLAGQYPIFHITGDMEAVTVTTPNSGITIENVAINKTAVEGYEDLYVFTSITFDATYGGTTSTITYNRVIVPTEVTAELSEHMSDTEIALTSIIPLLVILSLVIGVVAVLGRRAEIF